MTKEKGGWGRRRKVPKESRRLDLDLQRRCQVAKAQGTGTQPFTNFANPSCVRPCVRQAEILEVLLLSMSLQYGKVTPSKPHLEYCS